MTKHEHKTEPRTIRHAAFEYHVYAPDPLKPGEEMLVPRLARQGETVELLPHDIERGDLHGAFIGDTPAEQHYLRFLQGKEDGPIPEGIETTADPATLGPLAAWIVATKVSDVLDRADGDADLAAQFLEAERVGQESSGAEPRKDLVKKLTKIVEDRDAAVGGAS